MFYLMSSLILIIFKQCPRGYIEGGYYLIFPGITAGIIRVRVLFEGGSYMRKYGKWLLVLITYIPKPD